LNNLKKQTNKQTNKQNNMKQHQSFEVQTRKEIVVLAEVAHFFFFFFTLK
jgi:hypothetical protein